MSEIIIKIIIKKLINFLISKRFFCPVLNNNVTDVHISVSQNTDTL